MVLSLQRLTEFYALEIERGQSGLGNYNLRAGIVPVPLSTTAATATAATDLGLLSKQSVLAK